MVTAIIGSAADSGMPAGLQNEETTGISTSRTDISDGSITLAISFFSPGPSSASIGTQVQFIDNREIQNTNKDLTWHETD